MANNKLSKSKMREPLLVWYDIHQRILPWRALQGKKPNPYHVYLSEIMLQQTTVATVKSYFERFIEKWPSLKDLAAASLDEILVEWQGLGYYSRARNLHKAIQCLASMDVFPKNPEELRHLPGVGDYTSAAVTSIAFDYPIIPVDGNIMRVFSRVFAVPIPLPKLKSEIIKVAESLASENRSGDFAQALMDLGAMICKPKDPKCEICPLKIMCIAYAQGKVLEFPKLKPKAEKPVRYGAAFILVHQGKIFFEKRPEKGLLGGMMGVPTTPWEKTPLQDASLFEPESEIEWETLPKAVKHTFTHFHLYLSIKIGISKKPAEGLWVASNTLEKIALPTVMKKVLQKASQFF